MKATFSVDHRSSDGADIVPIRVSRAAEGAGIPANHQDDATGYLENPVKVLV